MYVSPSQKRIGSAVIIGAIVIAGAIYLRSNNQAKERAAIQTAAEDIVVTEAPKRGSITIADSNNDGVPDWQEALQQTEPLALETSSSTYAPPETLTEQFSQEFFENMVKNKTNGSFGKSSAELVSKASDDLLKKAADVLFSEKDIAVSNDNSDESLKSYGEQIALIMTSQNDNSGQNEAAILQNAIRDQNASELVKLDKKIEVYKNIIEQTKSLTVPSNVKKEHLDLLNSYQAIEHDIEAMRQAFNDPILALLRVRRYQDDSTGLYNAITNLYSNLVLRGITWEPNSVVYSIISINNGN